MSIPNLIYKIKSKHGVDKYTIMYLFIIVGVGIGGFGLGRLSYYIKSDGDISNKYSNLEHTGILADISTGSEDISTSDSVIAKEKRYVASKNGKIYYTIDCSGATRIKPENRVWFNTSQDAEKSGFIKSSSC